jgi:HrpA-like RNA helicase
MLLKLYQNYSSKSENSAYKWCKENMISFKALKNAIKMKQEIKYQLDNLYKNKYYSSSLEAINKLCKKDHINERILKCFFSSYFLTVSKPKLV